MSKVRSWQRSVSNGRHVTGGGVLHGKGRQITREHDDSNCSFSVKRRTREWRETRE
jgi:hypothetical protein